MCQLVAMLVAFFRNLFGIPPAKYKKYGWIPDHPDARDHKFTVGVPVKLPPMVDWRSLLKPMPPYDQSQLGSCTANGHAGAVEGDMIRQGVPHWTLSRLFLYYNERWLEGTRSSDSGAMIRDGIKAMVKWGFCPESMWPYVISKFKKKPPTAAYTEAARHKISAYKRVDNTNLTEVKTAIAQGNFVVFGFTVYDGFESAQAAKTGIIPDPNLSRDKVLGGHCMLIVGYDDVRQCFIVRNSWGTGWGDRGYCYMSYKYLTNRDLADDFWVIYTVPVAAKVAA